MSEPTKPFSLVDVAEVATKAIYTHGYGFREVVGPARHRNSVYVNLCWDDDTLVRAIFTLHPDETPDHLADGTTERPAEPREAQEPDLQSLYLKAIAERDEWKTLALDALEAHRPYAALIRGMEGYAPGLYCDIPDECEFVGRATGENRVGHSTYTKLSYGDLRRSRALVEAHGRKDSSSTHPAVGSAAHGATGEQKGQSEGES